MKRWLKYLAGGTLFATLGVGGLVLNEYRKAGWNQYEVERRLDNALRRIEDKYGPAPKIFQPQTQTSAPLPAQPLLYPKPANFTEGRVIDLDDPDELNKIKALFFPNGMPDFMKFQYAAYLDTNSDGMEELVTILDNVKLKTRNVIEGNIKTNSGVRFEITGHPGSPITDILYSDFNLDGRMDMIVGEKGPDKDYYHVIEKYGDKVEMYWIFHKKPEILDANGNWFPEVYDVESGRIFEVNRQGLTLLPQEQLEQYAERFYSEFLQAARNGDAERAKALEQVYSEEFARVCVESLLDEPEFSEVREQAYISAHQSMPVHHFIALRTFVHAMNEYQERKRVEEDRAMVASFGYSPDNFAIQKDAGGAILGLVDKQNPGVSISMQTLVERREITDNSGTTVVTTRRALTPQDAEAYRGYKWEQQLARDPVHRTASRNYERIKDAPVHVIGAAREAQRQVDRLLGRQR